jgi:small multidrug resistance pump
MTPNTRAFIVMIGVALVTVVGDYFLKIAGSGAALRVRPLIAGILIYGGSAFAWVSAMRQLKLATLSVVFTLSMLIFAAALGAIFFGERLGKTESLGILLAIVSILLLYRVSA